MKDSTSILGGQKWSIKFVNRYQLPSRKHMGVCEWDSKTILIYKRLPEFERIDTLIHECRHAQNPVLFEAEEFIDWTSTELARAILKTRILEDD